MEFIFNKNVKSIKSNVTTSDITSLFIRTESIYLDNNTVNCLLTNNRSSYREIAKTYATKQSQIFDIDEYPNDMVILGKTIVNNVGIMINCSNKNIYVNGGCKCNTVRNKKEIFMKMRQNIQFYENVLTITEMWGDGIWHFPYECLVALMVVPEDILKTYKIHVSNKNKYVLQWLSLLDIHEDQVVTGNIMSNKNTVIPRMGRCGNPYYSQIIWLRNKVFEKLNTKQNRMKYVIVVKRNHRRQIRNYELYKNLIEYFAVSKDLQLYVHDDNNLPPLKEQMEIFNNAKYVFSPHGASGIHLIAMQTGSHYIEFLNDKDINVCFMRLAYFLNIKYSGLCMKNFIINTNELKLYCKQI